ncbi:hypothetical protein C8Q76DRAFT_734014 [Earliella scabrosa]|nr:hypothetical protein C8Q76DRAFT_734014 [Earliella scabrosa]
MSRLPFFLGSPIVSPARWLNVGRSRMHDPVPVAIYLADLFPNLQFVNNARLKQEDCAALDPTRDWHEVMAEERARWEEMDWRRQEMVHVLAQERAGVVNGTVRCKVDPVPWNEGPAVVLERALQSEQVQSVLNAIERDRSTTEANFRRFCRSEGYI